jgi:hypothetical protein
MKYHNFGINTKPNVFPLFFGNFFESNKGIFITNYLKKKVTLQARSIIAAIEQFLIFQKLNIQKLNQKDLIMKILDYFVILILMIKKINGPV